ncbi:MAG: alanine--tRNA ligase-related protein [Candidatus Limivicinus sp.]|nr:alanine--tRNA ligase-related protein [Clostridiales bacterium]MDY6133511.1 alanine--tRNA ligase-related protein [Candidatus Limivicinus sp.]
MTEKLYYTDSHIHEFSARVLSCEKAKMGFAVVLDKTAFFPEGGGQPADTGIIGPAAVRDVQEQNGEIFHYTDQALTPGEEYACALDWEQRLCRMQNHSGEHIVSGITHKLYGFDNVGFHMGAECMTIDFSGELSWEQLTEIETLANQAVRDDLPVKTCFPGPEALSQMEYRSKLELTRDVRIVEIPGTDRCACCAPHVKRTGEIGLIKLLSAERHRGGVRIELVCGMDALRECRLMQENVTAISGLLSAKRAKSAAAVERVLAEQAKLKERVAELSMALARLKAERFGYTEGNICVFDKVLDEVALRELVNLLMEKCGGMAGAFSGSDETGYMYIIGSKNIDLRSHSREINAAINGKGGGTAEMIRGRASTSAENIQKIMKTPVV